MTVATFGSAKDYKNPLCKSPRTLTKNNDNYKGVKCVLGRVSHLFFLVSPQNSQIFTDYSLRKERVLYLFFCRFLRFFLGSKRVLI